MALKPSPGIVCALALLLALAACRPEAAEATAPPVAPPQAAAEPPQPSPPAAVTNYRECVRAGYPTKGSPPLCFGPDGQAFMEIRN